MSDCRKDWLSLYIHFPFCRKKCNYCDFYSINQISKINTFVESLCSEIASYNEIISNSKIYTIYIGGGSPDLLSIENFNKIIDQIKQFTDLNHLQEFTVEVNPGNISDELLRTFHSHGVNRISMGVQSFIEKELQILGRSHTISDVYKSIELVRKAGINSLSLDLIFGIPGQTIDTWKYSVDKIIKTGVRHLSFYNLIYETGTTLDLMKSKGEIESVNENIEWQMYQLAHDVLNKNGYNHYEISNWCQPDKIALHNSVYWNNGKYLGLGPAAHSFDKAKRWWNIRSVDDYINKLSLGKSVVDGVDIQNISSQISEMLLLSLRKNKGLNIEYIEILSGVNFQLILDKIKEKFNNNFIPKYGILKNNKLILTLEGWFICDYIIQEISLVTDNLRLAKKLEMN